VQVELVEHLLGEQVALAQFSTQSLQLVAVVAVVQMMPL
jgi:hypothetical protein